MTSLQQDDPRAAALAAAEALAAEGSAVTARAVRERASVQMSVAAEVAREWKAREIAMAAVPAIPEVVQTRLAGVWAEAVQAARAEHERAVEGWRAEVERIEAERHEAIAAADEATAAAERDAEQAAQAMAALRQEVTEHTNTLGELRAELKTAYEHRAAAREEAAEARGEATVLRQEIERLRRELADTQA